MSALQKAQALTLLITCLIGILSIMFHLWAAIKMWKINKESKHLKELKELALDAAMLGVSAYLKGQQPDKYYFMLTLQKFEREAKLIWGDRL